MGYVGKLRGCRVINEYLEHTDSTLVVRIQVISVRTN